MERLFAVQCARRLSKYIKAESFFHALAVAERYSKGEATEVELLTASKKSAVEAKRYPARSLKRTAARAAALAACPDSQLGYALQQLVTYGGKKVQRQTEQQLQQLKENKNER